MPAPSDPASLQDRLVQLAAIGDLRPGSLSSRFLRCGKPSCRCSDPDAPGHGPYWSLTFKSDGKTITRSVPPHALERTRQQIAEYKRFRALTGEFVEVSQQLCQARLRQGTGKAVAAGKKMPSRPPSSPKSVPRSERS